MPKLTSALSRPAIAILAAIVLLQATQIYRYFFLTDDAYITFRYAKNFALGRGLVWNVGEYVEGYTNFLWTILIAAAYRVGLSPEIFAPAASIAATAALMALLFYWIRRHFGSVAIGGESTAIALAVTTLALLALNRHWGVWATGGLETRLFTLLFCCGFLLFWFCRTTAASVTASLLLGLATLTRPDGMLLFAMTGVLAIAIELQRLYCDQTQQEQRQPLTALLIDSARRLAALGVPGLALVGAHLLFRYSYYGEWLPNTYYAKVDEPWPEMGQAYLSAFLYEYGLIYLWPLALLMVASSWRRWLPLLKLLGAAALLMALHSGYYLYKVGGDHFEYRIFDWYWPFLALLLAAAAIEIWQRLSRPERHSAVRLARLPILAYLLLIYTFVPNWNLFLPNAASLGPSQVPLEAPRQMLAAWRHLPPLRSQMQRWRDRQTTLQPHLFAIRREQHHHFAVQRRSYFRPFEGQPLPADAVMSEGGIGILGYFVDATLIDRQGLTDALIARTPWRGAGGLRLHAHSRQPPPGYIEERGFNFTPYCLLVGRHTPESATRCPWWQHNPQHRRPTAETLASASPTRLYLGHYGGNTILFDSTVAGWASDNFAPLYRLEAGGEWQQLRGEER